MEIPCALEPVRYPVDGGVSSARSRRRWTPAQRPVVGGGGDGHMRDSPTTCLEHIAPHRFY